jgi:hypothetical protein
MAARSAHGGDREADLARMRELMVRVENHQDWSVTEELGTLLAAFGHLDELVLLVDAAYDHGDHDALRLLDRWLDTPVLLARAVEQLEQRPDAGTDDVAAAVARLLLRHGRVDQLPRAAAGDHHAAMRAADALIERRRTSEAIDVLLAQFADGSRDHGAGQRAVALLQAAGRTADAFAVLRGLADVGDWNADRQCALLLPERGQIVQLRSRADAGSWHARQALADLLAERAAISRNTPARG